MKRTVLASLPAADQHMVFHLCSSLPYADVAALLAKPAPAGLGINVSPSSLCRFNARYNPEPDGFTLAARLASAVHSGAIPADPEIESGLITVLQRHAANLLEDGAEVADVYRALRFIASFQKRLDARRKALKNFTCFHDFSSKSPAIPPIAV